MIPITYFYILHFMKIENSQPEISIYSVKSIVENITYDETAIKEIDFYNKEFQRHYLATIEQLPLEKHTTICHILLISFDIFKDDADLDSINEEKFDILKMKVLMIIDDFIHFIEDNGLKDLTWNIV